MTTLLALVESAFGSCPLAPAVRTVHVLELDVGALVIGSDTTVTVTGAEDGEEVDVWVGTLGRTCARPWAACLDLHDGRILSSALSTAGSAEMIVPIDQSFPAGSTWALQATVDRGEATVLSRVWVTRADLVADPPDTYDDAFEDNDGLPIDNRLEPGRYHGLSSFEAVGPSVDFYRFELPDRGDATLRLLVDDTTAVVPTLRDPNQSHGLPRIEPDSVGARLVTWTLPDAEPGWYHLRIEGVGGAPFGTYDLDLQVDEPLWYADCDGDLYGDALVSVRAPTAPAGFVASSTDCDDADPSTHPGGFDLCEDVVDQDCDGVPSGACHVAAPIVAALADVAAVRFTGTEPALGSGPHGAGDVTGDGRPDVLVGTATDRAFVLSYDGPDAYGAEGAWAELFGATGSITGRTVADIGDIDVDGADDLAVVADDAGFGEIYLVHGPVVGAVDAAREAYATLVAWEPADYRVVRGPGDITGDGVPDVVVSGLITGYVEVASADAVGPVSLSSATTRIYGPNADIGPFIAAGDVDGDGQSDLLVGTYTDLPVFEAPLPAGNVDALSAWSSLLTDPAGIRSADAGRDLDGDGYADVALGLNLIDARGAVALLPGPMTGLVDVRATSFSVVLGSSSNQLIGAAVTFPGDFDGDGIEDLAFGDPQYGGLEGAAYVAFGPFGGVESAEDLEVQLFGERSWQVGSRITRVGDLDGDGMDDLAVGGGSTDPGVHGATYLLLGAR